MPVGEVVTGITVVDTGNGQEIGSASLTRHDGNTVLGLIGQPGWLLRAVQPALVLTSSRGPAAGWSNGTLTAVNESNFDMKTVRNEALATCEPGGTSTAVAAIFVQPAFGGVGYRYLAHVVGSDATGASLSQGGQSWALTIGPGLVYGDLPSEAIVVGRGDGSRVEISSSRSVQPPAQGLLTCSRGHFRGILVGNGGTVHIVVDNACAVWYHGVGLVDARCGVASAALATPWAQWTLIRTSTTTFSGTFDLDINESVTLIDALYNGTATILFAGNTSVTLSLSLVGGQRGEPAAYHALLSGSTNHTVGSSFIQCPLVGFCMHQTRWTGSTMENVSVIDVGGNSTIVRTPQDGFASGLLRVPYRDVVTLSPVRLMNPSREVLAAGSASPLFPASARFVHHTTARFTATLLSTSSSATGVVASVTISSLSRGGYRIGIFVGELNQSGPAIFGISNEAGMLLWSKTINSSETSHVWRLPPNQRPLSVGPFDTSSVFLHIGGSRLEGHLSIAEGNFYGLLDAPGLSDPEPAAVCVTSGTLQASGLVQFEVIVSGLSRIPTGQSEVVWVGASGNLHSATVTFFRDTFHTIEGTSLLAGVGTSAIVNLSTVLRLDVDLPAVTVIIRSASGVVCSGQVERVLPRDAQIQTLMDESTTAGVFNVFIGGGASIGLVGHVSLLFDAGNSDLAYRLNLRRADTTLCAPRSAIISGLTSQGHFVMSVRGAGGLGRVALGNLSSVELATAITAIAGHNVTIVISNEGSAASAIINTEPMYAPDPREVFLPETAPVGFRLFHNSNAGPFVFVRGPLQYTVLSDLFRVSSQRTGSVVVRDSGYTFDFNTQTTFVVPVRTTDMSTSRTDVTNVTVNLVDVNNHSPRWGSTAFTADLIEGSPVGTEVTELRAFDSDPTYPVLM